MMCCTVLSAYETGSVQNRRRLLGGRFLRLSLSEIILHGSLDGIFGEHLWGKGNGMEEMRKYIFCTDQTT